MRFGRTGKDPWWETEEHSWCKAGTLQWWDQAQLKQRGFLQADFDALASVQESPRVIFGKLGPGLPEAIASRRSNTKDTNLESDLRQSFYAVQVQIPKPNTIAKVHVKTIATVLGTTESNIAPKQTNSARVRRLATLLVATCAAVLLQRREQRAFCAFARLLGTCAAAEQASERKQWKCGTVEEPPQWEQLESVRAVRLQQYACII